MSTTAKIAAGTKVKVTIAGTRDYQYTGQIFRITKHHVDIVSDCALGKANGNIRAAVAANGFMTFPKNQQSDAASSWELI